MFSRKKPDSTTPKPTALDIALPALAGVLVVVMLVFGWFLVDRKLELSTAADVRGCFLAAAESTAHNLVNTSADQIDQNSQAILDSTTGILHAQFEGARAQFEEIARDAQAVMEGEVLLVAVQDNTDKKATVLGVAFSSVTNENTPEPVSAYYRMTMTVDRVDGVCKTSEVKYVTE